MDFGELWGDEESRSFQREIKIETINFEWDERKNMINKEKHGISFEIAAHVFFDENALMIYDDEHSDYDEDRYILIGRINDILYVVFTERESNVRLISARIANSSEEKLYYDNMNNR